MLALTSGVFLYYFSLYTNVLWEILGHDPKLCFIYVYIQCNKQDKYLQQRTKYYVSWVHVWAGDSLLDFTLSKQARSDFCVYVITVMHVFVESLWATFCIVNFSDAATGQPGTIFK